MEDISQIANGEQFASVRSKLNSVITRINQAGHLSVLLTEVTAALNRADAVLVASEQELSLMRTLFSSVQSQGYLSANGMEVYYPRSLSIRRSTPARIMAQLYPVYALQNVLYLPAGGDSLTVSPDGLITVHHLGATQVHVIPPGRTSLYRTINIEVRYPYLRRCSGGLRLASGRFRIV